MRSISQSHLWARAEAFKAASKGAKQPTTAHGSTRGGKGGFTAGESYRVLQRTPDAVAHIGITLGKRILRAHMRDTVNGPTPIGAPRTVESQIAALRQEVKRRNAKDERERIEREEREALRAKAAASKPVTFCGVCRALVPDARALARWRAHKPDCSRKPAEWADALKENPSLATDVRMLRYVRDLQDEQAARQLAQVTGPDKREVPSLNGSASDAALETAHANKGIIFYQKQEG